MNRLVRLLALAVLGLLPVAADSATNLTHKMLPNAPLPKPPPPPDPAREMKAMLNTLVVPEVSARQADPRDVLEQVRQETAKLSPARQPINLVWLLPADAKLPPVTVSLRKVTVSEALRYITTACGLRYRVEPNAVVIEAAPPAEPAQQPDVRP